MFRNLVIAFILALVPTFAIAQDFSPSTAGWFEGFFTFAGEEVSPAVDVGVGRRLTPEWGISAFGTMADGIGESRPWGEFLLGVSYAPIPEVELWVAPGVQQGVGGIAPRFAGSLWVGKGELSFYGWIEWDLSGPMGVWYDLQLRAQVLEWLRVALHIQRTVGLGPRIDIQIPTTPLSVWGTYAPWGPEEGTNPRRGLLGIILGF